MDLRPDARVRLAGVLNDEVNTSVPADSGTRLAIGQIVFARSYTIGLLDQTPMTECFPQPPGGVSHEARKEKIEGIKMNVEIIGEPIRFHLHGIGGVVEHERYGEVGLRLMNEMWQVVQGAGILTTGINHWVYLPDGRMFVGVELRNPQQFPTPVQLGPLEFELRRYMKHVHVGPYQALPQKWKELKTEIAARGEAVGSLSLEIYGHHCNEPSKLETTILIGLQEKSA